MALETVNERTTSYLSVIFKDRDGVPASPGTVVYSIRDKMSDALLAQGTPGAAATVLFTMGTAINYMVDPTNSKELRVLTYRGDYGDGDQIHGEYEYEVINLEYAPI